VLRRRGDSGVVGGEGEIMSLYKETGSNVSKPRGWNQMECEYDRIAKEKGSTDVPGLKEELSMKYLTK
jgi:hypothetical protein